MTGLQLYLDCVVFVFGAVIGSFLNVCIHRMPLDQSIVTPPSHCPHCNQRIGWIDNIPLVSYLVLGRKCRHCGVSISPRYFWVELLTATLFLAIWLQFGGARMPFDWRILPYWLLVGGLIVATFVDLEHYIVPDEVSVGGAVAGVLACTVWPALQGQTSCILGAFSSIKGMLIGSALLYWIAVFGQVVFKKEAMGLGDVKLMGMMGAFLGCPAVIFIMVISSGIGGVAGLMTVLLSPARRHAVGGLKGLLMFWRHDDLQVSGYLGLDDWRLSDETEVRAMGSAIPYGPYLALAAVLWIFLGDYVCNCDYIRNMISSMAEIGIK
jgi:leader peptidase (prepilin peptidase)/N-methyltransferase